MSDENRNGAAAPTATADDLNDRLRDAIERSPKTQKAIASDLGISPSLLSNWKGGAAIPDGFVAAVESFIDEVDEAVPAGGGAGESPSSPATVSPAAADANESDTATEYRDGIYEISLAPDCPIPSASVKVGAVFHTHMQREVEYGITISREQVRVGELKCLTCSNVWTHEPLLRSGTLRRNVEDAKWFKRFSDSFFCKKCAEKGTVSKGVPNSPDRSVGNRVRQLHGLYWLTAAERKQLDLSLDPNRPMRPIEGNFRNQDGEIEVRKIHAGIPPMTVWVEGEPKPLRDFVRIVSLGEDVDYAIGVRIPNTPISGAALERQQAIEAIEAEMNRVSDKLRNPDLDGDAKARLITRFTELVDARAQKMKGAR